MPGPSGNFIKTTYYNATTCGTNPVMFVYTPATGFCVPNYDEATKTTSYSQVFLFNYSVACLCIILTKKNLRNRHRATLTARIFTLPAAATAGARRTALTSRSPRAAASTSTTMAQTIRGR